MAKEAGPMWGGKGQGPGPAPDTATTNGPCEERRHKGGGEEIRVSNVHRSDFIYKGEKRREVLSPPAAYRPIAASLGLDQVNLVQV